MTPTPSRRAVLTWLAASSVAAPLAACGSGSKSSDKKKPGAPEKASLTVYWWGGPDRAKRTQDALDMYHTQHPEVSFTYQWQGYSGYYDKLSTNAAGGQVPDLFQIDDNLLTEYAERRLTLDLGPYVGKQLSVTDFAPGLKQYGTVQGKFVAAAAASNTPGLVYDKTLLQGAGLPTPQIGWSWQQYADWARQVATATGKYGTTDPSADYKVLQDWLRQQGKDLYKNGKLGFTEADLTKWFTFWSDLRKAKVGPPGDISHVANGGDVTKQLVVTKQAATSFMHDNQLTEMSKSTDHTLGVTAYPGKPSGQFPRAALFWSAYAHTKHPKVVASVIDFLVNDAGAGTILGAERGLPVNLKVRKQLQSTFDPVTKQVIEFEAQMVTKFGKAPSPPPKGHQQVRNLLVQAAETVEYDRASPQQAAAQFLDQAKTAIQS